MRILCRHPKKQRGCSACGGRGWIIESYKSDCCGRKLWDRAWPFTIYVGKEYMTFNGVRMTVTNLNPPTAVCEKCQKVTE